MVIPVATSLSELESVAQGVTRRVEAMPGDPVLAATRAATTRFETVHSAEAAAIAASDVERWANSSRTALRLLSRGDYDGARRALLQAQAISERAAEALNRETVRARQVLDTCLFVVRAAIETGDPRGAEAQARSCRRLVPRMQASTYTHTPEVRELVARIDRELEAESAGVLRVDGDRAGCNVRINGVYFGPTPLTTSELPRGDYRVQVECDETRSGRVHPIRLDVEDVELVVHSAFERAVHTRPSLSLAYESPVLASTRAEQDGATIARALGRRVLLVIPGPETWTVIAIEPRGRRPSSLRIASTPSEEGDSRLADALERDRDAGDLDSTNEPEREARERDPLAISLMTIGGATLATSVGLLVLRDHRGDVMLRTSSTSASYLANQDAYTELRPFVLATSVGGGLLASVGSSRFVRRARHPSVFAWIGGSVGLGLFAWATVDVTRAPTCIQRPYCTGHESNLDRATLLGAFATPMLAMPIAAALPSTRDVRVGVRVGTDVATLQLSGHLR